VGGGVDVKRLGEFLKKKSVRNTLRETQEKKSQEEKKMGEACVGEHRPGKKSELNLRGTGLPLTLLHPDRGENGEGEPIARLGNQPRSHAGGA